MENVLCSHISTQMRKRSNRSAIFLHIPTCHRVVLPFHAVLKISIAFLLGAEQRREWICCKTGKTQNQNTLEPQVANILCIKVDGKRHSLGVKETKGRYLPKSASSISIPASSTSISTYIYIYLYI